MYAVSVTAHMANSTQYQPNSLFQNSYKDYTLYPTNLTFRSSYRKVLESYKRRLDDASENLFSKEGKQGERLDVRFRDYDAAQTSMLLPAPFSLCCILLTNVTRVRGSAEQSNRLPHKSESASWRCFNSRGPKV